MKNKLLKYEHYGNGSEITHVTLFKLKHGYLLQTNTRSKYPEFQSFSGRDIDGNYIAGLQVYYGDSLDSPNIGCESISVRGNYEKFAIDTKNGPSLLLVDPDFTKSKGVVETFKPRKRHTI